MTEVQDSFRTLDRSSARYTPPRSSSGHQYMVGSGTDLWGESEQKDRSKPWSRGSCIHLAFLQVLFWAQGVGHIVRVRWWVAAVPMLVLLVLLVAGQMGAYAAAKDFSSQRRDVALSVASSAAQQVALQLQTTVAPNVAVAAAVKSMPYVPHLVARFPDLARGILAKLDPTNAITRINIIPWGVISSVYPPNPPDSMATLNYAFFDDAGRAKVTREFVSKGPDALDLIGPITLIDGSTGFVSRMALFLPGYNDNETWCVAGRMVLRGMDQVMHVDYHNVTLGNVTIRPDATACGAACAPRTINGTRWQFWGLLNCVTRAAPLQQPLRVLETQREGYRYVLFRVNDTALEESASRRSTTYYKMSSDVVVFHSDSKHGRLITQQDDPACSDLVIGSGVALTWALCVVPLGGWAPGWLVPMQIMISFVSVLIAGLLFCMMLSQQEHAMLVSAMLPRSAARVLRTGRAYVEPFQGVTVLFSDIVQYTDMSSQMPPNEVVELLHTLYQHFDDLVDRHGLYKVESVGDAFMCVGGAPERCSPLQAATRVARMALDMVDFTRSFVHTDGRRIKIRVGMYTGDATAAVMGRKMPHWTLVGDSVNIASRMETHSLPSHVHIGGTTAALLRDSPEFMITPRGEIHVKGKGRMATFFLSRGQADPAAVMAGVSVDVDPASAASTASTFTATAVATPDVAATVTTSPNSGSIDKPKVSGLHCPVHVLGAQAQQALAGVSVCTCTLSLPSTYPAPSSAPGPSSAAVPAPPTPVSGVPGGAVAVPIRMDSSYA